MPRSRDIKISDIFFLSLNFSELARLSSLPLVWFLFSRGHAILQVAVSVDRSVVFLHLPIRYEYYPFLGFFAKLDESCRS